MSAVQHTPGPWHFVERDETPGYREPACVVIGEKRWANTSNISIAHVDEANARLIAAAPDLLDALRLVERGMRQWSIAEHAPQWKAIYAAIAKAEGRP